MKPVIESILAANTTGDPANNQIYLLLLLCSFSMLTIVGNFLVVFSVVLKTYLQTPTGYFIVSMAAADLMVGILVMPFSIVAQATNQIWPLGLAFCDVWHSIDVLASTASIWNLAVISLDRYLAIKDPLSYRDLMTTKRVVGAITLVWVSSSLISFPAIFWWHVAAPDLYTNEEKCVFVDDLAYVVFSSIVSFYLPLSITLFSYWRVFLKASKHEKSLKAGRKLVKSYRNTSETEHMYIRIHRGGMKSDPPTPQPLPKSSKKISCAESTNGVRSSSNLLAPPPLKKTSTLLRPKPPSIELDPVEFNDQDCAELRSATIDRSLSLRSSSSKISVSNALELDEGPSDQDSICTVSTERLSTTMERRIKGLVQQSTLKKKSSILAAECSRRKSLISQKLAKRTLFSKYMKEKRAAKTLGLVVGCFVACWLPFFLINIIVVACATCMKKAALVFGIVTWLGHCNSLLNPIIYSCFNRDFKRAFKEILRPRKKVRFTTKKGLGSALLATCSVVAYHTDSSPASPYRPNSETTNRKISKLSTGSNAK